MLFGSSSFRADDMTLCLRASSCTGPDIITRCFATENIIRGKTPLATLTKKTAAHTV